MENSVVVVDTPPQTPVPERRFGERRDMTIEDYLNMDFVSGDGGIRYSE